MKGVHVLEAAYCTGARHEGRAAVKDGKDIDEDDQVYVGCFPGRNAAQLRTWKKNRCRCIRRHNQEEQTGIAWRCGTQGRCRLGNELYQFGVGGYVRAGQRRHVVPLSVQKCIRWKLTEWLQATWEERSR